MAPYNPPDAHYAHIMLPADIDSKCMKYVMGKNGTNLYNWTTRYKLQYIWLDNAAKKLELWGSYEAFSNGTLKRIEKNIQNRIKSYNAKKRTYDFREERAYCYDSVMKTFKDVIDQALPNEENDELECYLKDFYEETILTDDWKALNNTQKLEYLNNDLNVYMA